MIYFHTVVCCLLFVGLFCCLLLLVVCSPLRVALCWLFVACWLFVVGCFVGRCLLLIAARCV